MSSPMRRQYPRRLSAKRRIKRGFSRYLHKKRPFAKNLVHRRVKYRNRLWEQAPLIYFVVGFSLIFLLIIIDLLNITPHPFFILALFIIITIATFLELYYVGGE